MLMRIYIRGALTGAAVTLTAGSVAAVIWLGAGLAYFLFAVALLGWIVYRDIDRIAELDSYRIGAFADAKEIMRFVSEEREERGTAADTRSFYYQDALAVESRALGQVQRAAQDVTIRDSGLWGE